MSKYVSVMACSSSYIDGDGSVKWTPVEPRTYGTLAISPASHAINYGSSIFEGMKARYCKQRNRYLLFRPELNHERMKQSSESCALEAPSLEDFKKALMIILENADILDEDNFLYLRPVIYNGSDDIGVYLPKVSHFYIIGIYFKVPYFASRGIRLATCLDRVRAWPGGTGDKKYAGNYGGVLSSLREAQQDNCDQVLWLFPKNYIADVRHSSPSSRIDDYIITEAGVSNIFFIVDQGNGIEVYTPELAMGLILPGITRLSTIQLLREMDIPVHEVEILMHSDFIQWIENGYLLGAFSTGTASGIVPINMIYYLKEYNITAHSLTSELSDKLIEISLGKDSEHLDWIV